jgi:hypothetical protein
VTFRLIFLDEPGRVEDAELLAEAERIAGGLLWQLPEDPDVYVTDDGHVFAEQVQL